MTSSYSTGTCENSIRYTWYLSLISARSSADRSPPFSSLYTYSNSDRDLGNSKTDDEFYQHFRFITEDLYRSLKPGRIMADVYLASDG